jgi:GNAT superfamily N-acetyltransferase
MRARRAGQELVMHEISVREVGVGSTQLVHRAMAALRPHHDDVAAFVARVDGQQRPQGYRLLGAFLNASTEAVGVLGLRHISNLWAGDILYVDDLSTLPEARRRGVARALLDAVVVEARSLGCAQVHLDSGHQRHAAHKVYLEHGFEISSHHFSLVLE